MVLFAMYYITHSGFFTQHSDVIVFYPSFAPLF